MTRSSSRWPALRWPPWLPGRPTVRCVSSARPSSAAGCSAGGADRYAPPFGREGDHGGDRGRAGNGDGACRPGRGGPVDRHHRARTIAGRGPGRGGRAEPGGGTGPDRGRRRGSQPLHLGRRGPGGTGMGPGALRPSRIPGLEPALAPAGRPRAGGTDTARRRLRGGGDGERSMVDRGPRQSRPGRGLPAGDARRRAQAYAGALDERLGTVLSIEEPATKVRQGDGGFLPARAVMASAPGPEAAQAPDLAVHPGELEVSAEVDV